MYPIERLRGLRAVAYCRVSTEQQVRGKGLSRQEKHCVAGCHAMGMQLITVIAGVERCETSPGQYRPVLEKALSLLESGEAEVLIVESMCRLAVGEQTMRAVWERVRRCGGKIVMRGGLWFQYSRSSWEAFDPSAEGAGE